MLLSTITWISEKVSLPDISCIYGSFYIWKSDL